MITKNTRIYLKFLLFLWLTAIAMRIGFLLWQWESLVAFSWADIAKAFYIGIRFDNISPPTYMPFHTIFWKIL